MAQDDTTDTETATPIPAKGGVSLTRGRIARGALLLGLSAGIASGCNAIYGGPMDDDDSAVDDDDDAADDDDSGA